MQDFHGAGGLPALMRRLPRLDRSTTTADGRKLGDVLDDWPEWVDGRVIRDATDPVAPGPAIVALRGNLAPDGAVLKAAAASGPGMPEAGSVPIPAKLARQGVKDMVRVSDARMSGTASGTVILHAAPEAAVGGPLALVRDGDIVRLDVAARRLDLLVDDDELARRRREIVPPALPPRGYARLYAEHVLQADGGCDFDFLIDGRSP